MIPDETIINHQQQFAKSEGGGKSMRWERCREEDDKSPGGELVGSFTAERTSRATLNPNITHIPTWHYVGGARVKMIVPGRKNCGHCLKSVGECESGGVWSMCEDKKTPRGNWKEDLEQFLRTQCDGWDDKKQKEMESLEKKDVEAATAGDDEEAEFRIEEERAQLEEEAKEGLVQQVAEDKICGALLLMDLPEGDGDKTRVEEEVLLMVIYASKLENQEADRMRKSEVKILPKRERSKKDTIDISITLGDADQLLRKVWRNLEKACKQEGVKRYQTEASTVFLPVKKKPPSLFMKSRKLARDLMEAGQKEERDCKEQERVRQEEEKLEREGEDGRVPQEAEVITEDLNKDTGNVESSPTPAVDLTGDGKPHQEKHEGDAAAVDKILERLEQPSKYTSETPNRLGTRDKDESDDSEEESSGSQLENNVPRVRKPLWKAQDGFGICGKGCEGCAMKCAEQRLPNCQNCHLNMMKNTSNYGCHNRKKCLEPKPKLVKGSSDKVLIQKKPLTKNLRTARIDRSVSPMVQENILHITAKRDDDETRKPESERSPGDTPPGKGRKETRIP